MLNILFIQKDSSYFLYPCFTLVFGYCVPQQESSCETKPNLIISLNFCLFVCLNHSVVGPNWLAMEWSWLQTGWQGLPVGPGHTVTETSGLFAEDFSTDRQWEYLCSWPPSSCFSPSGQPLPHLLLPAYPIRSFRFYPFCHHTFLHLHSFFAGPRVLEFLWSLTGLLLGPVWVGWAGWTPGVLGIDRATTLSPLGPALLTQRRASWCLRITGGRWVDALLA